MRSSLSKAAIIAQAMQEMKPRNEHPLARRPGGSQRAGSHAILSPRAAAAALPACQEIPSMIPQVDIAALFGPPSPARESVDRAIMAAAEDIGFLTVAG